MIGTREGEVIKQYFRFNKINLITFKLKSDSCNYNIPT
jgi:hypothetical protein